MFFSSRVKDLLSAVENWCREELSATTIADAEDAITKMPDKLSEHLMAVFGGRQDPKSTYEGVRTECECVGQETERTRSLLCRPSFSAARPSTFNIS